MSQEHVERKTSKKKEEQVEETPLPTESADTTATDELLDQIDELLEVNAEEFVRAYVQKGGQ